MAFSTLPSTLLPQTRSFIFSSLGATDPSPSFKIRYLLTRCSAKKKKIGFFDQILDYIEGGPKLRKWYGAPDLLSTKENENDNEIEDEEEEEERDTVLVTDGDSEIGQMIILQLILKRSQVKALVKDKRTAMEAFGTYVKAISGDASNKQFITKALKGVRAIISPNEGFVSKTDNLKGVKHVILLSQLSVYRNSRGVEAIMTSGAKKLTEQDESLLKASGIPYTIIRVGTLTDTPGGKQGFSFEEGSASNGSLSKEDAASICVEALAVIPDSGLSFEVVNGEVKVLDWAQHLITLLNKETTLGN